MSRRLVRHPGILITALAVATVVGVCSVGSMVQVFVVGTSRLGLDSPAGVALSALCASLATATIIGLLVFVIRAGGGGYDDDDLRRGDDEPPPPHAPRGPFGEPDWWPNFEQELATYVEERDDARRRGRVPASLP